MFPLEINVNVYEINFHLVLTHYFMVPQVQFILHEQQLISEFFDAY